MIRRLLLLAGRRPCWWGLFFALESAERFLNLEALRSARTRCRLAGCSPLLAGADLCGGLFAGDRAVAAWRAVIDPGRLAPSFRAAQWARLLVSFRLHRGALALLSAGPHTVRDLGARNFSAQLAPNRGGRAPLMGALLLSLRLVAGVSPPILS